MIRVLVIVSLMILNVVAMPLVDVYRLKGLEAVALELEKALQTPTYWQQYINKKDVSLGYYETDPTVVVVDKKAKILKVLEHQEGKSKLKLTQEVIVGKTGAKEKEGDLKTPVGVYEVRRRFTPSDPFYGPVAFALSYPNTMDRLQGKNGHGIWIHGYPLDGSERDDLTKGCVVMTNELLNVFDGVVGKNRAITIISEEGEPQVSSESISHLLAQLYQWRHAWKENLVNEYLAFYHQEFRRYDGMGKKQFTHMKKSIFKRNEKKTIQFKDVRITPYPNLEGREMYRIAFYENYNTKRYQYNGNKELYVELKDNAMKILAEK